MTTAPAADGRDRARRVAVMVLMLALFVVALGVFLLPFAFPTPPPIVTRFGATRLFSPNGDGHRDRARINIRLHEPSMVTVEILQGGTPVNVLLDDIAKPRGFFSTAWDGTDHLGRRLPDGTYAIKLRARAGDKKFNTTRNITIDTVAPRPETMSVVSATLAAPGPGECRLTYTARDPGSLMLSARRLAGGTPVRRLGARPVRPGQAVHWNWDGVGGDGTQVAPGTYEISAALSDAAGNSATRERTCWVGRIAGTPTIARPAPRSRVGVRLRTTSGDALAPSTPISLVLRRRTGVPGRTGGDPLGAQVGGGVRGRAGTLRITMPRGVRPAALWLVASTLDGRRSALVSLGGRP